MSLLNPRSLDAVGVVVTSSPDFVDVAMGLLRRGRVVVPLRSRDDDQRIQIAGVRELVAPRAGGGWFSGEPLDDRSDRVAQLMFTSGTEGEPKCVTLRHRALFDVVERLNGVMRLDSSVREYVGVPAYYSFGFGRCRAILAAGGRGYIPPNGFNPIEIASLLERAEINAISAVPSLWRVLMSSGCVSAKLAANVNWIEIGSQYMSREEKERLRALFSNAIIVQHYGLTEASRTTFLTIHETQGEQLESVGRAYGAVELKITEAGRIAIRGPHVTDQIESGGKVSDPRDAEGWFETNDLGQLRDGYLHYLGRADDIINCGGLKLPPEALEAKVRKALHLSGAFAICRAAHPVRGDGILIVATPEVTAEDSVLLEAVAGAAQDFGVNARGAIHVTRVKELPRTTTGKVQRRTLAEQHALIEQQAPESIVVGGQSAVRRVFQSQLGKRSLSDTDSFVTLGGDSLAFIQMSVALEGAIGYLPRGWEHASIVELEKLPVRRSARSSVEPVVWMRALAIMAIVSNHVELFGSVSAPGGAFLLFLLAGATFARFQLQRVALEGTPFAVLGGLPKLLVPTLGLLLIQQLRHRHFEPSQLLLISNFVDPELGGYWFIEVWIQTYAALFLVFSLPPLARLSRNKPLPVALTALAIGVVLRVAGPLLWNTDYLFNRLPHFMFWSFALGWTIALFGRARPLLITALILLLAPTLTVGLGPKLWVTLGALSLLWLPPLRLPASLAWVLAWVSAASLYIYIAQPFFFTFAQRLTPGFYPFSGWLVAMLGGGLLRVGADYGWSFLRSRIRSPRRSALAPG